MYAMSKSNVKQYEPCTVTDSEVMTQQEKNGCLKARAERRALALAMDVDGGHQRKKQWFERNHIPPSY